MIQSIVVLTPVEAPPALASFLRELRKIAIARLEAQAGSIQVTLANKAVLTFDGTYREEGEVFLELVNVPPRLRRQGRGNVALTLCKRAADRAGVAICLHPVYMETMDELELRRWYARNGWAEPNVNNLGPHGLDDMIYYPPQETKK